ncbi:von Willebrand factor type A domain protein [Novipirellula aureliae]|uniref:von Willebrand factor type A domain protein n=2 Tax=Novipirellula aureliae TaxID=2527966 RepID=A0A5C6DI60_9BACT|nr:von Willebrand factor type A domain protein [Novipirellula aureliae]
MQSLGRGRCVLAILTRSIVITAIVSAIAGIQIQRMTDRITVMYVIDQSDSIDPAYRSQLYDYARQNAIENRDVGREDLAGVILFGADAAIELPPLDDGLPFRSALRRVGLRTDATNLEDALRLAASSMPSDTRRRIVVFSDGNQTRGQVERIAANLVASRIGIDFVTVPPESGTDVILQRLDVPSVIRDGQPIETRVLIEQLGSKASSDPVKGRLRMTRNAGGDEELLLEEPIELKPGSNVFPIRHTIDRPGAYTYTAEFIASDPTSDTRNQNNRTTAFVNVVGKGRVLMITPARQVNQWESIANLLRDEAIEVTVQASDSMFGTLAELQAYSAVILADLPRASDDPSRSIAFVSDQQIAMLVRNTQQLGAGLLMIGGPDSFGAGGWTGTEIERAMPVDFEIKNSKVAAVGALALVIDSSGSMDGEKMMLCKAAARAAVQSLGARDYIGITAFDSEAHPIVPMQTVADRTHLFPLIGRIATGGGTNMFPAMQQAVVSLVRNDAAVKHMILLTDGRTMSANFDDLVAKATQANITITSVAIGADADVELMRRIATGGNGKLYHVHSPRAIPQIVMRETRRVSRPLIFESQQGVEPTIAFPHATLSGIDAVPPVHGFVMTTIKDSPLAQSLIVAPGPMQTDHPLLAAWQFGLGRSAVWTTDTGQRWATDWNAWPGKAKLISQLVRWLMRPTGDTGDFTLHTRIEDGKVQIVVNAINQDGDYLDFLEPSASVLDPKLNPVPVALNQTAPGRYVGSFPTDQAGVYFIQVTPGAAQAPLTAGVTVTADDEYRSRTINEPLIRRLTMNQSDAEIVPLVDASTDKPISINPFRRGLPAIQTIRDNWPTMVVLGCCVFFADCLVRRIAFQFNWINRFWTPFNRQPPETDRIQRLDALQHAKREATTERSTKGFVTQFNEEEVEVEEEAELTYSERLLQAKRRARSQ